MSVGAGTFDLLGLAVVLLAAGWGAWYGALSQVISLATLVVALVGARFVAPHLEAPLSQALALEPVHLPAAAWVLALGALLLGLSLLARLLRGLGAATQRPRPLSRVVGGALGLAKGGLLVLVAAYGAVYAAPDEQARVWGAQSRMLPGLARMRPSVTRGLDLPECTEEVAARVEGWLPSAARGG